MKIFKTIKAIKYSIQTKLGPVTGLNVEVRLLVDGVDRSTFDQERHDHLLGSEEIDRLAREAAATFIRSNYMAIVRGEHKLTAEEVSGIRMILGLNASEFADQVGLSKGTMSRVLSGKLIMKRPESILTVERLIQEITEPGRWNKSIKREEKNRRLGDRLIA